LKTSGTKRHFVRKLFKYNCAAQNQLPLCSRLSIE
jgi:hypothetical protein